MAEVTGGARGDAPGFVEVEREERDGVPVYWAEAGPRPMVALVFRVGRSDEVLARLGLTHLVEHLALFELGHRVYPYNGLVDDTRTIFHAEGTPEELAEFISRVCAALRELPLERVEAERRVLRTESAATPPDFVARLGFLRFGATGPGLAWFEELGLRWLGADDAREWCARHFVAQNAALWMSCRPPEGLEIDLPGGSRTPPPEPRQDPAIVGPTYTAQGTGGVAVSFLARRTVALVAGLAIGTRRIHDHLRLEKGLTYATTGSYNRLTAELAHTHLGADCLDEHAAAVRDGVLGSLRALAETGPTQDELRDYADGATRQAELPDTTKGTLDAATLEELYGTELQRRDELHREMLALTPDVVAEAMAAAMESALLVGPATLEEAPEGFGAFAQHEPLEGRIFKPKDRSERRAGTRLVLAEEGVSLIGEAPPITVRFADCVAAVEEPPASLTLIDSSGSYITVPGGEVRDGPELIAAVREAIPDSLIVPTDDPAAAVEAVASEKLKRRWVVSEELGVLGDVLDRDEELLNLAEGSRGLKAGLIALTDRRLLWLYKNDIVVEHPLTSLDGASNRRGLGGTTLRVETPDGALKLTDVGPKARAPELEREINARAGSRADP